MRARLLLTGSRRALLLAALLCVLLARIAVPAGWMPMLGAHGGIVLAPCSGMGAMTVTAHAKPAMHMPGTAAHDGTEPGDQRHPDPAGDHPCSGAGVAAALAAPLPAASILLVLRPATFVPAAPPAAVGQGLAAPPPPPTGPPILV